MNINRRKFLVWSSFAALGLRGIVSAKQQLVENVNRDSIPASWVFFTSNEAEFISAIADKLIPADIRSPSATEAGVVDYIDLQLAGPFGAGNYQYMEGPFYPGTPQQGDQLDLIPRRLYRSGMKVVGNYLEKTYHTSRFADLKPSNQLEVISAMESGELESESMMVKAFFNMLLNNVMEGYFSDPIYQGNRNMVGWKLVGFPGVDAYYLEDVGREGLQYRKPPVGLKRQM